MGDIKVGYHTITWGRDFDKALTELAEVGYKAFETFGLTEHFDKVDEFKKYLKGKGVELASVYCGGSFIDLDKRDEEIENIVKTAEFIKEMGSDRIILGGGRKKEEGNTEKDYKLFTEAINIIGERAMEIGIKACYHPHWGTMVENREQLTKFLDMTDPEVVFLCPDTAHLKKGGADPFEVFQTYLDRIAYVHFKDIKEGNFMELGEGEIDFPPILKLLTDAGYKGWLVVELDSTTRTPKESAQISKKYLEEVLNLEV